MNDDVPSEEQMSKCFGNVKNCSKNCPIKNVCLDKYKEEQEEKRRSQYRDTAYIDEMDSSGDHVAIGFSDDAAESYNLYTEEELLRAIDDMDISEKCRRELYRAIRSKCETESSDEAKKEMLRRLGEIYVNDPTGFEVMFFQILAGGNQAALARIRGCTKQNINKIVSKGKKRLEAYRKTVQLNPGCRLSFRELAVFHALEIENLTYRQTADLIGCSFRTVGNIAQKMCLKGVKLHKKRPGRRKRNKKSNKVCNVDVR